MIKNSEVNFFQKFNETTFRDVIKKFEKQFVRRIILNEINLTRILNLASKEDPTIANSRF
jgi:hypothetical protein